MRSNFGFAIADPSASLRTGFRFWIGGHFGTFTLVTIGKSVDGKKSSIKDSNAYHELLRSNDLELGAESDLFCEVPSIRGEKPVGRRLQGGHEHGDIGLVTDQMAMPVDFLLGRNGNELRLKEPQQRAVGVYGLVG